MVKIYKTSNLEDEICNQLNKFIDNEFGHISIVKETDWASPDWTIIYFLDEKIAAFCNIVEREVSLDSQIFKAAGLNNVITVPDFRRRGLSAIVLREAEKFIFEELKKSMGLLLCADNLLPFYERLNWYKIECPVIYKQKNELRKWTANTMLLSKDSILAPAEINLNGLPW